MRFDAPPARSGGAGLLPMINVVFLLLVFLLVAARLEVPDADAPEPPVIAPEGIGAEDIGIPPVVIDRSGEVRWLDATGAAALGAASAACARACAGAPLRIVADRRAPAAALARALAVLRAAGAEGVVLRVLPR